MTNTQKAAWAAFGIGLSFLAASVFLPLNLTAALVFTAFAAGAVYLTLDDSSDDIKQLATGLAHVAKRLTVLEAAAGEQKSEANQIKALSEKVASIESKLSFTR